MIAVIVVRDGVLPAGFDEAICEADHRVLLIGSHLSNALEDVVCIATSIWTFEVDPAKISSGGLARLSADCVHHIVQSTDNDSAPNDRAVILPASPDGRDLAPRLALALDRSFHAGVLAVTSDRVTEVREGGLRITDVHPRGPFVATLQIGIRGSELLDESRAGKSDVVDLTNTVMHTTATGERSVHHVEIQPPDASTMDLAEAPRILGGGAGLDNSGAFDQLRRVAARLGASMGVTRVITDRGWAEHNRQIGTTGVVVDPDLYISFGISGAVQHTSGLGDPNHIISVNTDAHCPMMQISDVAIVSDANAVLGALETLLDESGVQ